MSVRPKRLRNRNVWMAWVFGGLVLAGIAVGITLLDSPAQERLRRLDERRIDDLRSLSFAINVYWTREGSLPSTLELLAEDEWIREVADPSTGEPYGYRPVGERTYELCATFDRESVADERAVLYRNRWQHGPGETCFEIEASIIHGPEFKHDLD